MSTAAIKDKLNLSAFFTEEDHKWDLRLGTINNQGGTRLVYLSSDIIRGIYYALEYECGDSWRIVLKNCGYIWGRRVSNNLDREMGQLFQSRQAELNVPEFVRFLEAYFPSHGWGNLSVDLSMAPTKGLIRVSLRNSIFDQVLSDITGFKDQMIEGMLRALFEHISGRELDCVQVSQSDDGSEFVITSEPRISAVLPMIEEGGPREEIWNKLTGG